MRTYVRMIVCVHLPRFELVVAAGERSQAPAALAGRALAVAPQRRRRAARGGGLGGRRGPRRDARDAARRGARPLPGAGAAAGRSRCAVAEAWEDALRALESIGAAVEPARPGLAYFAGRRAARPARHGARATIAAARARARARRRGSGPGRPASARWPPRWRCARAARSSLEGAEARRWLAGRPVELLGFREETAALLEPLGRLGVRTLGELARLGRAALADRFGAAGRARPPARLRRGRAAAPAHAARSACEESMEVGDAELRHGAGARARGAGGAACSPAPSAAGARCAR